MNLQFKLKDILEVDLYYGFYDIYVLGGFDVQVNDDFFVEILDLKTNESIVLTEKSFKARDYKNGQRAVNFFSFQIIEKSTFKISFYSRKGVSQSYVLSLYDYYKQLVLKLTDGKYTGESLYLKGRTDL